VQKGLPSQAIKRKCHLPLQSKETKPVPNLQKQKRSAKNCHEQKDIWKIVMLPLATEHAPSRGGPC
jgi:hypothetical protein